MLYLYDKAICDDLADSFGESPVVKVIDPEGAINVAAQIQNDEITYPIISLYRSQDIVIDNDLYNYRKAKVGIPVGFDNKTNNYFYEKVIPVKLEYEMTIITTNQADMDEIVRELLFKYSDQYFLNIQAPYEIDRKIRFGVQMDKDHGISQSSRSFEYLSVGKLYQSVLKLKCMGCVLLSYTEQKLKRTEYEIEDARGNL